MLLFDIIRDWFVMYIWGGTASNGNVYDTYLGNIFFSDTGVGDVEFGSSGNVFFKVASGLANGDGTFYDVFLSLPDWLSFTSTIIVMILLCVVFGLMVRWLFRLTAGLLRGN